jgi:hypothetical protein
MKTNGAGGSGPRCRRSGNFRKPPVALDGDHIWCVGRNEVEICKLQMSDGVAKIVLDEAADPSLHGLDIKDGVLWYCGASKGWIRKLT